MQTENHLLKKRVNLFDGISIVAGAMIGSGIFIKCGYCQKCRIAGMADGGMAYNRYYHGNRRNKLW